jgi:hypothetical protein
VVSGLFEASFSTSLGQTLLATLRTLKDEGIGLADFCILTSMLSTTVWKISIMSSHAYPVGSKLYFSAYSTITGSLAGLEVTVVSDTIMPASSLDSDSSSQSQAARQVLSTYRPSTMVSDR